MQSFEGTTQGGSVAMPIYALLVTPLMLILLEMTSTYTDSDVKIV